MSGRSRPPLAKPAQIAYAVTDVWQAAARFAATTGAGPFFVVEHVALTSARVRGVPGAFDHSSAYGQWGATMVELVVEHTRPIGPTTGVHHLAFFVDDLDDAAAWCARHGWGEALRAETAAGLRFAFHDAGADHGHLVELYEPAQRLVRFYAAVAAAADGWDGTRPVRPAADLLPG